MDNRLKKIAILGSTGSIGQQALEVIRAFPAKFKVVGLAGGKNTDLLKQQIEEFRPGIFYCSAEADLPPEGSSCPPRK